MQNEKTHPEILFYALCSVVKGAGCLALYCHE